jgi:hypothetical protein
MCAKRRLSAGTEVLAERRNEVKVLHQYDRHPELAWTAEMRARPRRRVVRRAAPFILLPLAGVAAFVLIAGLVEAFTDRDWTLNGMEWPADFLTAAVLVLLVPLALGAVRALMGAALTLVAAHFQR